MQVQLQYANPSIVSKKQVDMLRQQMLTQSSNGARDYAIVCLLAYAGLRVNEAVHLEQNDVNLQAREIAVRAGKGNKHRIVYINDKTVHAISEYIKVRH